MATKKSVKKAVPQKIRIYGTRGGGGVIVNGTSAVTVRRAMAAFAKKPATANNDARTKVALKLLNVLERFIKSGGRFKKRYHQKKKK